PGDLPHQVFLRESPLTAAGDALDWLAMDISDERAAPLDTLHGLNRRIHDRMRFDVEATGVGTSAEDAFGAGHGVCQDFAHIFIAVARVAGIPARYVSGHIFRRDGAGTQPASHAWTEAWVPDLGWVAFDPTNGICADDAYVRIAAGLDYGDVAPIVGARRGGGTEEISVEVQVVQSPRTTQLQQSGRSRGWQSQSQSQSQGG
ncbi:MAG TPA: transglutaminase family protein, partial [Allosphingosinicella sp.]